MKKNFVICAGMALVLVFTGCKSSESAYKKAYEKAKAAETAIAQTDETVVETPVVTPMVETPATKTTVVATTPKNVENESVRTEELSVVDGAALKNYSVVVGSFSLKANAEGLAKTLRSSGYEARIAYNEGRNMYRVVASSFNTKADAVVSRDQLREKYPDAWLLFQK
jgi:cell division protein FtsN